MLVLATACVVVRNCAVLLMKPGATPAFTVTWKVREKVCAVPSTVVGNTFFESQVETTDEWIVERTGIRARHFAAPDQTSSDLGTEAARRAIWLVDSEGLVHKGRPHLDATKSRYARPSEELAAWTLGGPAGLVDVVSHVRPTVLIGTSAQPGAFSEPIVRSMASGVDRPMIFPLSNPTSKAEAVPADLLAWTNGRAIVATGSYQPKFVPEWSVPQGADRKSVV